MWVTSCFSKVVVFIYHYARRESFFFCRVNGGVLCYAQKRGEMQRSKHRTKDLFVFSPFFVPLPQAPSLRLFVPIGEHTQKKKKRRKKKRHRANHHFCHARIRTHARAFFSDPSISISLCVFIQYASTSWESEQLESACVFWNKIRESSHSTFLLCVFSSVCW